MKIIVTVIHLALFAGTLLLLGRYLFTPEHGLLVKALAVVCGLWVLAAGVPLGLWIKRTF